MKRVYILLYLIFVSCSKDSEVTTPTEIIKYTLTISDAEGGTVSSNGGSFEKGSSVTISATPNTGYIFDGWSDGNFENPRIILVNNDITLEAKFSLECVNQAVPTKNLQLSSYELFEYVFPEDPNGGPIWDMIHTISWYGATGYHIDYNNDGYLDVIGYSNNYDNAIDMPEDYTGYERKQPIRFYLGTCEGEFVLDQLNDSSFLGLVHGRKLLLGDFNNDQYVDFFLIGHGYDKQPFPGEFPKVLMSNGQGGFVETEYSNEVSFFHGGSSGDYDNDGDLDVFLIDAGGGKSAIYVNQDGNLTPNRELIDQSTMWGMFNTELFDINKDGQLDIIAGGHDWSNGTVYDNTPIIIYGDGIDFKNKTPLRLPESVIDQQGVVTDFEFYDISGNGEYEIIVSRTGDNTINNSNFYRDWSVQILELQNGNYVDATETYIDVSNGEGNWIDWINVTTEEGKVILQNGKYPQQDQYKRWELSNSKFLKVN